MKKSILEPGTTTNGNTIKFEIPAKIKHKETAINTDSPSNIP